MWAVRFLRQLSAPSSMTARTLSTTSTLNAVRKKRSEITVSRRSDAFDVAPDKVKDRQAFIDAIERFKFGNPNRRGHVEFILTAGKHLEAFGVHRDLEIYKMLLNCFPKGPLLPQTLIQAHFHHHMRNQDAALDLMFEMDRWAVMPDREMRQIVLDSFGPESFVFKKYARMMFWLPKFNNASPWPLPDPTPSDALTLAHLAINRMAVDPSTVISEFSCHDIPESNDKTWIVSGQSPDQRELLLKEVGKQPIYIEGPNLIWIRERVISYFMLSGEAHPRPKIAINADDVSDMRLTMFGEIPEPHEDLSRLPSIHEQKAYTVFAFCATGTSSRDSLLSWLRFLQRTNPCLKDISVVFKLKAPSTDLTVVANESPTETGNANTEPPLAKLPDKE